MKPYKKIFQLLAFIASFTFLLVSCKKDKPEGFQFEGFDVLDISGTSVTHVGPADKDWTFNNTLTAAEMALFNFAVEEDLLNTSEAVLSTKFLAYPNPSALVQNLVINASDSVLLKLVFVDRNLNVLTKGSIKFSGNLDVMLDYSSDSDLFPDGSSVRLYYSFSALNKPNYKAGYGDIKICYGVTDDNYMECF